MHLLFVHQNFPAQFGQIADYLARYHSYRCTFVSEKPPQRAAAIAAVFDSCARSISSDYGANEGINDTAFRE